MEELTSTLENLRIQDNYIIKYLKCAPLNTQKCFISYNYFNQLNIDPGSNILIEDKGNAYICTCFPRRFLQDYIIEIDRTVYLPNSHSMNTSFVKKRLRSSLESKILKEIKIELIFDSIKKMLQYYKIQKHICEIFKNYLLSSLTLADGCHIDFNNFDPDKCMNIYKIIVSFDEKHPADCLGVINNKTVISISKFNHRRKYELETSILPPLYEMDIYFNRLLEIIHVNRSFAIKSNSSLLQPTKQILLVGSSGCGKSSLVTAVAHKTKSSIVYIYDHVISQKEPGESESMIRELFDQAFNLAKIKGLCIIALEEVSNLCPKRGTSSSHVQRASSQILSMLDKAQKIPGVIIIATTSKPHLLDISIRRHGRLETEIYIAPPSQLQRQNIIYKLILDLNIFNLTESNLHSLSQSIAYMTPGYVGADLKQICQRIIYNKHITKNCKFDNTVEFWINEFRSVISSMTPASLKGTLGTVTMGHITFKDLAALIDIKKTLEIAILWPITHLEAFKRMGITRPKGVLLYGPPGCAKTSLIRAIACLGAFSLLSISAAELYSPYVGDAERLIVKLFERARQNTPCLIFIDEIDALAGSRGTSNEPNSDVQERILASLLTEMDGIGNRSEAIDMNKTINTDDGVIVVGATNRPDMIDPALLRPGRFDKHILVPPPNEKERLSILKLVTKCMPLAENVDLADIASKTKFFSGADMKNICMEAGLIAMTENGVNVENISNLHFQKALSLTRPSLNESQIQQYYTVKFQ